MGIYMLAYLAIACLALLLLALLASKACMHSVNLHLIFTPHLLAGGMNTLRC